MSFAFLLVALVAAGCVAVFLVAQRGTELKLLAERGEPTKGRVVERRARHARGTAGRHRRVKIAYEPPGAAPQERWIVVTGSEWDALQEGASVDLVYLPARPSVFAMRSLVNQARAAKNLPPLS